MPYETWSSTVFGSPNIISSVKPKTMSGSAPSLMLHAARQFTPIAAQPPRLLAANAH
jgi:hypothetical protein